LLKVPTDHGGKWAPLGRAGRCFGGMPIIEAERCCGELTTVLPRTQNGVAGDSIAADREPRAWTPVFGAECAPPSKRPVPGEGLEPPTNGLQNRCSTAELTRQINGLGNGRRQIWQQTWQNTWQQN
jgi:hypothetical protein